MEMVWQKWRSHDQFPTGDLSRLVRAAMSVESDLSKAHSATTEVYMSDRELSVRAHDHH
jgi:hypothetical protein